MRLKWFYFILFTITYSCSISAAFLDTDLHIPYCSTDSNAIRFRTTHPANTISLPLSLLRDLQATFNIDVFIETGTYLGETALHAAQVFDKVHTIELSKHFFSKAVKKLRSSKNVKVHLGDSSKVLKDLLIKVPSHRILFYLDGHYSGMGTARGSLDTPILQELKAIGEANKTDSILLIDDVRLFQSSAFPKKLRSLKTGLETYPDLKEIIHAILQINSSYQFCFLGDVLLAFPKELGVSISPVMRACALHRLEALLDLSEEEMAYIEEIIGKAEADEKIEIENYYKMFANAEFAYGWRSYSSLWYALTLQNAGYEVQALSILKKAAKNSTQDWRIIKHVP